MMQNRLGSEIKETPSILYDINPAGVIFQDYQGKAFISYIKDNKIISHYDEKKIEQSIPDILLIDNLYSRNIGCNRIYRDLYLPLFAELSEKGIIHIKNIITGVVNKITKISLCEIPFILLCNGNIYIYSKRNRYIKAYMSNESQRSYNMHIAHSNAANIIGVIREKEEFKYYHIDLKTGESKLLVRSFQRIYFMYGTKTYAIFRMAPGEKCKIADHRNNGFNIIREDVEPYNILRGIRVPDTGYARMHDFSYIDDKIYSFDVISKDLQKWGIKEKYDSVDAIHYITQIRGEYYGISSYGRYSESSPFYCDRVVKFGRCCICGQITSEKNICNINEDTKSAVFIERIHGECTYKYRDYVMILLKKHITNILGGSEIIGDYIYKMLFGNYHKVERKERLVYMIDFYKNKFLAKNYMEKVKFILVQKRCEDLLHLTDIKNHGL